MGTAVLALIICISVRNGLKNQDLVPGGCKENITEAVIQAGSDVTLKCHGNGTVKWIIQGKKNKYITNDTLQILNAGYKSTTTYTCVYNSSKSMESASVHLFVKDESKYWNYLHGYILSFEVGKDALIPCLLTDPSIPESAVSLESLDCAGKKLNISFEKKKGFTIRNVQMNLDECKFYCKAKVNGIEKKSTTIKFFITYAHIMPSVSLTSHEHMRIQGEDLIITCIATSNVQSNIKWEHKTEQKTTTIKNYDPAGGVWTVTSILTIQNVTFEDSGNYTCIAENNGGSNSSSANLQVIEKAFVDVSTAQEKNMTLLKGDNVVLNVDIKAYPSKLSWDWLHNKSGNARSVSSLSKMKDQGPYSTKNILILNRLNEKESGTYTFSANNSKTDAFLSFEIKLYSAPTVDLESNTVNGSQEIKCTSQGFTLPTIQWLQCPNISCTDAEKVPLTGEQSQEEHEDLVISTMRPSGSLYNITIFCTASNIAGNTSTKMLFNSPVQPALMVSKIDPEQFSPLMVVVAVLGVFFLLLSAFLFYKYKQKPKYAIRWQMVQMSEGNQYLCIDPTQLPYNERWEFPRANLQFGKTIGAGAFGKVMEATAFGMGKDDSALRVAVKMLKPSAHTDEKEALMSELKILSHLGHHENVVNLLGACTSGGPILVITEYCQHGDLLNFMRRKAEVLNSISSADSTSDYKNMAVEQKYLEGDSGQKSEGKDSYIDMKPINPSMGSTSESPLVEEEDMGDHLPLDLHDLLNFSLQVAEGMSFLASKNCIHRDVAARNVLVTQGRVAKICDFGLARDIENDSNYVVKGNARLPVKWMAPESIFDCIYTVQSDVWSYGILLWEIFSLGRSPYPGVIVNRKFYKMIKDGFKMDCPDYSPLAIYRIMKACWDLEPTRRPTFKQVTELINRQMSLNTNQEYTNVIQEQQDEDCSDTKCVDPQQPLVKGNNYQFC
ncbi:macrophage colony-stimulating factor 1 receptor [Rhinoderma darwinii]|uniref:macrophage colony-stimulating factor 1 receptor n=1 Tax=Rhinoderma darwinii TaxID=43563 RepID=UPI003F671FBA